MIAWAKELNIPFCGYHYVYPCDSKHPAASQAKTFHDAVGGDTSIKCMLDWESDSDDNCHPPGNPQYPTWTDVLAVLGEIRKLGHKVTLIYAPHWYWAEDSPNLAGVGLDLVSAHYGTKPWPVGSPSAIYSVRGGDTGVGWNSYGGLTPVFWQYTCQATWGNMKVDFNGYRGDPAVLGTWFTDWTPKVAEDVFPYGYSGSMKTMAQLEAMDTVKKLNPEFWRRFKALMQAALAQKIKLGVGTGWRVQPVNPDGTPKPGFALPGNSNHEGFPADGKTGGAVAIDAVLGEAFPWMEKNCKAYGLRTFLQPSSSGYLGTNEPWHVQPAEIPASRRNRKEPWVLKTFQLPNAAPVPPKEVMATPSGSPSFKKGATDASTKMAGAEGGRVTWLQTILRDEYVITIVPDGQFGAKTDAALRVMQKTLSVKVDGVYGEQTAAARYAKVGK
jgi:hypothetical protein